MRDAFNFIKKVYGNNAVTVAEVGCSFGNNMVDYSGSFNFTELALIDIHEHACIEIQKRIDTSGYSFAGVINKSSVDAAGMFPDNHFDFIYIDADHSFVAVTADLNAWYPKVKPGGWILGHDYNFHSTDDNDGVTKAVQQFRYTRQGGLMVFNDQPQTEFAFRKT